MSSSALQCLSEPCTTQPQLARCQRRAGCATSLHSSSHRLQSLRSFGCISLSKATFVLNGSNGEQALHRTSKSVIVPRCCVVPSNEADIHTEFVAETLLPTRSGKFRLRGYRHTVDAGQSYTEPSCLINGRVENCAEVLVRVHDACFTSEVLGSLKCDCAEQLQLAMDIIQDNPPGMIIYLQQEGRGIGLANKIAAYSLQEKGLDTVDANRALGLPDDCREYTSVRNILRDLNVKSVRLLTNNPRKINQLQDLGVTVTDRIPCIVQSQKYNEQYLEAKRDRMDHLFDGTGQYCFWNHEGEPSSMGLPLTNGNG